MTISLVQQPDTSYTTSGTAKSNTFSVAPTEGNLIVFSVVASNNVTISADDGTLTEIVTGYETFRRLSVFAKIAGASEPTTYNFTFSGSATGFVFATEYSTTDTWDAVAASGNAVDFDSSGSNSSITNNITTTAGSLLVALGYSSNSTTDNQEFTTGYGNFEQANATGNARWAAQADKTTSGGADSATFNLIDNTNNDRLAVAVVEFTVTSSRSITNIDGDNDVQAGQTGVVITAQGLDNPSTIQTVTLGGETLTVTGWA